MATELQQQLSRIRDTTLSTSGPIQLGRPSLFLSPKEAAGVDVSTIYDAAINGLSVLQQYDNRFEIFLEKILHPSSVSLQRELKTSSENSILDNDINAFLSLLSLFASESAAHKILEYLIRRYRIHEMNVDALIKSMLHLHDSKIFVRIIELCSINNTIWSFLETVKTSGVCVARNAIVRKCQQNMGLMSALCQIGTSAITLSSMTCSSSKTAIMSGFNRILSFVTAILVEVCQDKTLNDSQLRQLFPFLIEGLRSSSTGVSGGYASGSMRIRERINSNSEVFDQWRRSSCMVMSQICVKTQLAKPILKSFLHALADSLASVLKMDGIAMIIPIEIICTMSVMAHHQPVYFGTTCIDTLIASSDDSSSNHFLQVISKVSEQYDISALMTVITNGLVASLFLPKFKMEKVTKKTNYFKSICSSLFYILNSHSLGSNSSNVIALCVTNILNKLKASYSNDDGSSVVTRDSCDLILQHIGQKYPTIFDSAIKSMYLTSAESGIDGTTVDDEGNQLILSILGETFSSASYRLPVDDAGLSLLLSLQHSSVQVRVNALKLFGSSIEVNATSTPDIVGLVNAAFNCLGDHDIDVVTTAFTSDVITIIAQHVDPIDLVHSVDVALSYWIDCLQRHPHKCVKAITAILAGISVPSFMTRVSSNASTGVNLIFLSLLKLGVRSYDIKDCDGDSTANEIMKSIDTAVYRCANSIKNHIPLLGNMQSSIKSGQQFIECISSCIVKSIGSDVSMIATMYGYAKSAHHHMIINQSYYSTHAVMQLFYEIVKTIDAKGTSDARNYQLLLSIICPLVLDQIMMYECRSEDATRAMAIVGKTFDLSLQLLLSIITVSKALGSNNSNSSSDTNAVTSVFFPRIVESISACHIGHRILCVLLSSSNDKVVPLITSCLGAYFTGFTESIVALLQVATSSIRSSPSSFVASTDGRFFIPVGVSGDVYDSLLLQMNGDIVSGDTALLISRRASAGAITALSSCISSFDRRSSLNAVESHLIYSMLMLLIPFCSSSSINVRSAGLACAKAISLLSSMKYTGISSGTSINSEPDFEHIHSLSVLITQHFDAIVLDPSSLSPVIINYISNSDGGKTLHMSLLTVASLINCWEHPALVMPILVSCTTVHLDNTWSILESMLDSSSSVDDNTGVEKICSTLIESLTHIKACSVANQSSIVAWMVKSITASSTRYIDTVIKETVFELLCNGWIKNIQESNPLKDRIFNALCDVQMDKYSGRSSVQVALSTISIRMESLVTLLSSKMDECLSLCKKAIDMYTATDNSTNRMIIDDEDTNEIGLALPLQKVCNLLEGTKGLLFTCTNVDSAMFEVILIAFLNALAVMNHPALSAVMSIDYCKSLVMDYAADCIDFAIASASSGKITILKKKQQQQSKANSTAAAAKRGRSNSTSSNCSDNDNSNDSMYSSMFNLSRVSNDIEQVLISLGSCRATQVQTSALRLLKLLVEINPAVVHQALGVLGTVLASNVNAVGATNSDNRMVIIKDVLTTFVSVGVKSSSFAQKVLEPLCLHYQSMAVHNRNQLQFTAMDILGGLALPASVVVLLTHAHHSYQPNKTYVPDESEGISLILLSKASQRKATKALKTSLSEELFRLSIEASLRHTALEQVGSMILLVKAASHLLESFYRTADTSIVTYDFDGKQMCIDMNQLTAYSAALSKHKANESRSSSFILILLLLEYISEVLESRQFHRCLVPIMEDDGGMEVVQLCFLELSEQLLQLLQLARVLQQKEDANTSIYLGDNIVRLSMKAMGTTVWTWCLDILKCMQRLLDAPTFVSILQELVEHEDVGVRQKALHILGQRLEEMNASGRPSGEERALLLDLVGHLRSLVHGTIATITSDDEGIDSDNASAMSIGLAQSALMCMDLLARYLGKGSNWVDTLKDTLHEVVTFSTTIAHTISASDCASSHTVAVAATTSSKKKKSSSSTSTSPGISRDRYCELVKLLGSAYLCCGTLSSALGPLALSSLNTIMNSMLQSIEYHVDVIRNRNSGEDDTVYRARILLLRSSMASVTVYITDIPNFSHPYVSRIIGTCLQLKGIEGDDHMIDKCFSAISTSIQSRLSVPSLLEIAPDVLVKGDIYAKKFASLLGDVWKSLDRGMVLSLMPSLCSLATLGLDYRRAFGTCASGECDAACEAIADAIVELCVKLTENELKSFLARLSEWKDAVPDGSDGWKQYSRTVSFYQLLCSLGFKLRSIFIPSISLFWQLSSEYLHGFHQCSITHSITHSIQDDSDHKKQKKRKSSGSISSVSPEAMQTLGELVKRTEKVLVCVRNTCVHDNVHFVDENNYNIMIPKVTSILSSRDAFVDDSSYIAFCEDYIIPCITSLAVCANKDVLWKPLNNKVLQLCRDRRKSLRIIGLKALHKLFIDVGEEYLLLLPECLPYLSELLEDDVAEVATLTGEVIRYIEDLSGEKLDTYLQ